MNRTRIAAPLALLTLVLSPALFADTGLINTVAGSGMTGTAGVGGPATSAQLSAPVGLCLDSADNMYITDSSNNRVVRVDAVNGTLTVVAGNGTAASSGDSGPATLAPLNSPAGVALDTAGNLYISEFMGNRIRRVDAVTGIITTIAGTGTAGFSGDGSSAGSASLNHPRGIAVDAAGNLFITDYFNIRIRRVDAVTGIITTVAGNGANATTPDGTPAAGSSLHQAMWVSIDPAGNLLIIEYGSNSIRRVDKVTGLLSTVAGNGAPGFTGDGIPATSAGIQPVANVAFDSGGNFFFADASGRIRRVDAATGLITTVAGNGSGAQDTQSSSGGGGGGGSYACPSNIGDNGPATIATLDGPGSVWLTRNGNLVYADWIDCRVRRVYLPSPYPYTNTSLTASATTIPQGQTVTYTATVSPIGAGGVPTGAIQFVDAPLNVTPTVLGTVALNNGTASLGVSTLQQFFAHRIVAYYSGDSVFNGSGSPGIVTTVTAPKLTATLSLSSSQNPANPNTPVTFTLTVAPPAGNTTQPTGSVQFTQNGVVAGTVTLANGAAQFPITFTTGGTQSINAIYQGDSNYNQTTAVMSETIKSAGSVSLTSSANPASAGAAVTFTASVSPASGTGTVQLMDGATSLGSAPVSTGTAVFTLPLTAGTHSLQAVYSGDASVAGASSAILTETVKSASTVVAASSTGIPTYGQTVTFAASVTPAPATGTVQFLDGGTPLGSAPVNNGIASINISSLTAGSHSVTAVYSGDSTYAASTSAPVAETVSQATPALSVTSTANPATVGQFVLFNLALSPVSPGATLAIMDGPARLATVTPTSAGAASYSTTTLTAGYHPITIVWAGNANVAAGSSAVLTETVQSSTTVSVAASGPVTYGQPVTFTATVSPSAATGTIQFNDGGTLLGAPTLSAGRASITVPSLTAGTHLVVATYQGDGIYIPNNASVSINVATVGTTAALVTSPNPSNVGQAVTLTATVSPASATGQIQFMDGATLVGASALSNGTASVIKSFMTSGSHSLTAVYAGDLNFSSSTSAPVVQTVKNASSTTLAASPASPVFGQVVTLTSTVTPSTATGSVQFLDGSTSLGTMSVTGGAAALPISTLATGSHTLTAIYSGDANDLPSTSAPITVTVAQANAGVALTSSQNPSMNGQSVIFTATVSPSLATGMVQFLDGSTSLGSVALGGGSAALPLSSLPVGTHSITAVYSGDVNFAAAASQAVTQVVNLIPGFITPFAGTGVAGTAGTGGPAASAQLTSPGGMALDSAGNLFIADIGNNRVVRVDAATRVLTVVAGNGTASSGGDGGPASMASLNGPAAVTFDTAGNLFISETGGNQVRRVDGTTAVITTVAGNGIAAWSGDGGPAVNASVSGPVGLAFDSTGNLYIADMNNARVRRVDATTGIITTVAGNGTNGPTTPAPDGTPALYTWLSYPMWVSFDRSGSLLISEVGSGSIQRVDAAGLLRNVAGTGTSIFTADGVPAAAAGIGRPSNIAVDPAGNLFFADFPSIRRIDASTGLISTVAGNGTGTGGAGACMSASNGDNGPATDATLDGAFAVLLMPNGNLLFSDYADCRVRQVALPSPYPYTATNLTANAASIGQNQNVTFTANVSPISAGGTPTGTVRFVDEASNSTVLGSVLLNGGAASLTLNSLSLGAHGVVAFYSGDSGFNSSASAKVFVRVQLPTTVTLTSGPNPSAPNQAVTVTATIPQLPNPSNQSWGSVNLLDGATSVGWAMVFNGTAQFTVSFTTTGTHSLTAVFTGSDIYAGSTSAVLNQIVAKTAATVLLTSGTNPSVAGSPVTFTASVSPASATGTVQFLDGSTVLGTVVLVNGTASIAVSTLTAGSHSIQAVYSGDNAVNAASSAILTQSVQASTTVTLSSSNLTPTYGQSVQLTASVSPASATGTIQFMDGTTALGSGALSGGSASLAVSSFTPGTHSITAVYSGDANDLAGTSAVLTETVNKVPSSVSLSSNVHSIAGDPVTMAAAVSPVTATGTVQFLDGATSLGTATVVSGQAVLTTTALAGGNHSLTAVYSGDTTNAGSTSNVESLLILFRTSTTIGTDISPVVFGQQVKLLSSVTPSAATGTITFGDGNTVLGVVAVSGGSAAFPISSLSVGNHLITAVYSGDPNYGVSTSAVMNLNIGKGTPALTLSSSLNPSNAGQTVSFTAALSPGTATGSVQFSDGATSLGTVPVSGGSAVLSTSALAAGSHSITAAYSGDGNFNTASGGVTQVVKATTTTSLSVNNTSVTVGQAVLVTAAVSPGSATGTVQVLDGATSLGTSALSGGTASLSVSTLTVGTHSLTAVYSGDGGDVASTSSAVTVTVSKASSTVALASSLNPSNSGQNVTFTASVTPTSATGTVQFMDGATVLGTVAVSGGSAALSTSTLVSGSHSITAAYSGDATFNTASGGITQVVKATTTTSLSANNTSVTVGQAVQLTAAVSPGTATGTVQFLDGSTSLGTSALSGGTASLSVSTLTVGTHSLTAVYSGDGRDTASTSSAVTVTVSKASSTVALASSLSPSNAGQNVAFTATVTPTSATGTVEFMDGATVLGTVTISGGSAALSTAGLAAGSHTIAAVYSGDGTFNGASGSILQSVKANTVTSLTANNPTVVLGQTVQFTASVAPSSATGTIQFKDGASVLGTVTPSGGSALLAVSSLTVGTHSITAVYSGDSLDTSSTSAVWTETVTAPPPGPPSNLIATAASPSQINLTWSASATSGVTYNVYASTLSGFTPSASNRIAAGVAATAYSNIGLTSSTTYYYVVTAQNSAGESTASNQATATTQAGASCQLTYSVTTQWNVGFGTAISIKNTGISPIHGWKLTWTWPGNQQITQSWNSTYTESGPNATLTNASWNGTIAPGATVSGMGFNASYSGTNPAPTAFYVNGALCH